jgi:hypothetical protein
MTACVRGIDISLREGEILIALSLIGVYTKNGLIAAWGLK